MSFGYMSHTASRGGYSLNYLQFSAKYKCLLDTTNRPKTNVALAPTALQYLLLKIELSVTCLIFSEILYILSDFFLKNYKDNSSYMTFSTNFEDWFKQS